LACIYENYCSEGAWRVTVLQSPDPSPVTELIVSLNHCIADVESAVTLTTEMLDRYIDYEERTDKLPPPPLKTLQEPPQIQPITGFGYAAIQTSPSLFTLLDLIFPKRACFTANGLSP